MATKSRMGGTLLEALHRLQEIGLGIAEIERRRGVKTRRVDILRRKVKRVDEQLGELQQSVRGRQVKLDALTLDVAAKEEVIKKHREALNRAKTNKEYAGILAAMNTEKADTAKLESGVLELMDATQMLKDQAAQAEVEKQRLLEEARAAEKKVEAFDAECSEQRSILEANREQCADAIPPGTLAAFTRVAERHEGEAMASVAKLRPKREDYACSGCHMTVSLETVNALQSRDEIQYCGSCGRILFCDPSLLGGD